MEYSTCRTKRDRCNLWETRLRRPRGKPGRRWCGTKARKTSRISSLCGGSLAPTGCYFSAALASYVAVLRVFFAFLVLGADGTVLAAVLVSPETVLDAVPVALRSSRRHGPRRSGGRIAGSPPDSDGADFAQDATTLFEAGSSPLERH